jgi:hypothetical protein
LYRRLYRNARLLQVFDIYIKSNGRAHPDVYKPFVLDDDDDDELDETSSEALDNATEEGGENVRKKELNNSHEKLVEDKNNVNGRKQKPGDERRNANIARTG